MITVKILLLGAALFCLFVMLTALALCKAAARAAAADYGPAAERDSREDLDAIHRDFQPHLDQEASPSIPSNH